LSSLSLAKQDARNRIVIVCRAYKHEAPSNPNVLKAWATALEDVPDSDLVDRWLVTLSSKYNDLEWFRKGFHERFIKPFGKPFGKPLPEPLDEGFPKPFGKPSQNPLPNQEQEQDRDQDQERDQEQDTGTRDLLSVRPEAEPDDALDLTPCSDSGSTQDPPPAPPPPELPKPTKPDPVKAKAERVIEIAKSMGRAWRKPHRHLLARIREGATVDDCVIVLAHKTAQWQDDSEMAQYIRQVTLYGPDKWEGYLDAAREWDKGSDEPQRDAFGWERWEDSPSVKEKVKAITEAVDGLQRIEQQRESFEASVCSLPDEREEQSEAVKATP